MTFLDVFTVMVSKIHKGIYDGEMLYAVCFLTQIYVGVKRDETKTIF